MAFKWRGLIMEFIGAMTICYIGGWSQVMRYEQNGSLMTVALCHMFVYGVLTWCGAAISGAHYNPAVTISLLCTGNCDAVLGCLYFLIQFAGSFVAALMLNYCTPRIFHMRAENSNSPKLGYPFCADSLKVQSLFLEMIGTFVLVFIYFALCIDKRAAKHIYGIAVGGAYGISILAFGPVSGAALNPARWLGPAMMEWLLTSSASYKISFISQYWVYLFSPFVGGLLAAALYNWTLLVKKEPVRTQGKEVEFD